MTVAFDKKQGLVYLRHVMGTVHASRPFSKRKECAFIYQLKPYTVPTEALYKFSILLNYFSKERAKYL